MRSLLIHNATNNVVLSDLCSTPTEAKRVTKKIKCGCHIYGGNHIALCKRHWKRTERYTTEQFKEWADKMRAYIEANGQASD